MPRAKNPHAKKWQKLREARLRQWQEKKCPVMAISAFEYNDMPWPEPFDDCLCFAVPADVHAALLAWRPIPADEDGTASGVLADIMEEHAADIIALNGGDPMIERRLPKVITLLRGRLTNSNNNIMTT